MTERACVFTSLFGGYEDLLEQPEAKRSGLDFICFTDDADLRSETWHLELVLRKVPDDPQCSSRYQKICPHHFLGDYELSLYIDNSVLLKQPPEHAFEAFLPEGELMGVFAHSFRATVADEFAAVMQLGFDYRHVCVEQLDHYRRVHPDVLDLKPIIGGVLLRRHLRPEVVAAMETWWDHLVRYSRRDQLSVLVALKEASLVPYVSSVDIRENDYWRWPASTGRRRRHFTE